MLRSLSCQGRDSCIYSIMENIPAHSDLFQFIQILWQSNFLIGHNLTHGLYQVFDS